MVASLCKLPCGNDSAQVFVVLVSVRCVRIYRFLALSIEGFLAICSKLVTFLDQKLRVISSLPVDLRTDMRNTLKRDRITVSNIINCSGLHSEHNCWVHIRNWDACTLIIITKPKVV